MKKIVLSQEELIKLKELNEQGYVDTEYEKLDIAKKHLVKKQILEHGLSNKSVSISDSAILSIIRNYTKSRL